MKTSLFGKVTVTVAVLLAAGLPLLAGSRTPAGESVLASLASPLRDVPSDGTLTARKVIRYGVDHTATAAIPKSAAVPVAHPKLIVRKLKMTSSGLVGPRISSSIKRCYNTTPNVWLTFDDGYTSQANLDSILGTLRTYNVRGRFFLIGSWARQHPSMVRQIVAGGHFVENHTNTHAFLGRISDSAARDEIRNGQPSNTYPKLLRPPYGDAAFTVRLYNLAQEQGYLLCHWNTDTRDWAGASAAMIIKRAVRGDRMTPRARAGDTVLMHLKNTQTRYALPGLIEGLRARGLKLDQLR